MAQIDKIHRKVVVNDAGEPTDVIIPWDEYREIVEVLGLDLDETTRQELQQAQGDRESGNGDAFLSIDEL
jgi:PHD/YefM family antitoxin component YafN of YafNO toxin-antitoxin module